jgi:hypothetical protein
MMYFDTSHSGAGVLESERAGMTPEGHSWRVNLAGSLIITMGISHNK